MSACGFPATCGRPARHRGHHGGWRSGVRVVAPNPVERVPFAGEDRMGAELTPRSLAVVAEYLIHGGYAEAGACLGIAEQTAKNHGRSALARTGAVSVVQLAWLLGWLRLPAGLGHAGAVA